MAVGLRCSTNILAQLITIDLVYNLDHRSKYKAVLMTKVMSCFLATIFSTNIWATPEIYFSQTYYKIKGYNAEELRTQLNELGPYSKDKRYDANTTWHINWTYKYHYDNPSQNPCYLTEVKVSATIVSILPEWEDKEIGDLNTQMKWDKFLIALRAHEEGHTKNGKEAANEIDKTLSSIPSQPNCRLLEDSIKNKAQAIIKQHNIWDEQYDATTDHGKKDGAVFP